MTSMMTTPTSFERFEYKYWVSHKEVEEVLRLAANRLRRDGLAHASQRNTSLYLDSPDLEFWRMHVDSAPDRFKLRVRAYGDPPAGPAFLEIKRKVKAITLKRRAAVPLQVMPALLGGGALPPVKTDEERRTMETFLYLMLVHRAEPQVLVTCCREAYASTDPDENVRLTLDRDIEYQPTHNLSLLGDRRGWLPLCGLGEYRPQANTLIELKFRGVAPLWVQEMAQRIGLRPSAYSKYVAAMSSEDMGPSVVNSLDLVAPPRLAIGWGRRWGRGGDEP